MRSIKRFQQFNNPINEVSVENTYLGSDEETVGKNTGPFAEAPKTKGKSWGLKFEDDPNDDGTYFVIFPDYMIEQIKEVAKDKNGEVINRSDLENIKIESEGGRGFNRTHFPGGIGYELRGIGLGYIIYEEFIKFLGYASSSHNASELAQKVWKKVAADPDFIGITYKTGILVFYSKFESEEMVSIAIDYLLKKVGNIDLFSERLEDVFDKLGVNIDPVLIEMIKKSKTNFRIKQSLSKLLDEIDDRAWKMKQKNISRDGDIDSLVDLVSVNTVRFIKDEIFPKLNKIKEKAKEDGHKFSEGEQSEIDSIESRYTWFLSEVKLDIPNALKKIYNKYSSEKVKEELKLVDDIIETLDKGKSIDKVGKKIHYLNNTFRYYDLRKKLNETFRTKGYQAALTFYDTYIKEQSKDLKIEVVDDYTWAEDLFIKYQNKFPEVEGLDKKAINLLVEKHFVLQMKCYKVILFATYEKISKKMEKMYFEGGYDKAKTYFDSVDKKKLEQIPIDIEDDNGYGLTKGTVVSLPAIKHLENRLEAYSKQPTPPKKPVPVEKPVPPPQEPDKKPVTNPTKTEKETKVPERTILQRFKDFLGF